MRLSWLFKPCKIVSGYARDGGSEENEEEEDDDDDDDLWS